MSGETLIPADVSRGIVTSVSKLLSHGDMVYLRYYEFNKAAQLSLSTSAPLLYI